MRKEIKMKKYDCIIIGGGIAGITAAIYLKQANKYLHTENYKSYKKLKKM